MNDCIDNDRGTEAAVLTVWRPPSWIFPFPVWSHSILMSLNGKLDPENIGIAVEISLISCLEAEIHAFGVFLDFSTSGLVA